MNDQVNYFGKKVRATLSLFFVLLTVSVFGQEKATVYGTVKDNNGESIVNATIIVNPGSIIALSDVNGKYSIDVPADSELKIKFTFADYTPYSKSIYLEAGQKKKVNATLVITELTTVDINARRKDRIENMDPIDPNVVNKIPSPNEGIEGVIKSQLGVKSSNELSSNYSVRGGSFDENLVYVNDIEVYRPFLARSGQQEGLSFPNPNMTASILFSAGGFDARFGDKMSSVLDIKYKKPTGNEASVLMSMLGGSAHFGSSIRSGRIKQITGVRYKTNSYLLGALETQGDYTPRFVDVQSFWDFTLTDNWKFGFLGNYANNLYRFEPSSRQTNFGSINEALRLSVLFEGQEQTSYETFFGAANFDYVTDKMVLKFIGSAFQTYEEENFDIFGRYRIDELERDLGSDEFGEAVNNIGIGGYIDHARNTVDANVISAEHKGFLNTEKNDWKWGLKFQQETIDDVLNEWEFIDSAGYSRPQGNQSEIVLNDRLRADNNTSSERITAYLQDTRKWKLKDESEFDVTFGARATHWTFNDETLFSPRGRISYSPIWKKQLNDSTTLSRDLILRASGGVYYQQPFYREMRDLQGVVNPDIEAQRSIHAMVGADMIVRMWERPFKIVTEAYYKKYDQLIPYKVEGVRLRYFADNLSEGYAQGIDFKINGEFVQGVESWMSVSYLKTEEDLFNDQYTVYYNAEGEEIVPGFSQDPIASSQVFYPGDIPRPTDQRVSFNMFFQDRLPQNPTVKVQLSLNYGSGLPFGPPGNDRYTDVQRSTDYRRVDVGFTKMLVDPINRGNYKDKWFKNIKEAWVSLEVFNLLNINNSQSFTWFAAANGRQYSIPNNLTARLINLKLFMRF